MNAHSNSPLRRRALPVLSAFAASLLALPVSSVMAQSFPQYPLQTGAGNAEPNIMFILDDSGSMAFDDMPNPAVTTVCRRQANNSCFSGTTITDNNYVSNTVYYNPAITYQPWLNSNGTRMTGGTSYAAAFGSFNYVGGTGTGESDTINLQDGSDCQNYDRNNSGTDVCGGIQTFYVPKNPSSTTTSYLQNSTNYYRYQHRVIDGTLRIIRSELLAGGGYGDFPPVVTNQTITDEHIAEWNNEDFGRNDSGNYEFSLGFNVTSMRATLRGDDPNAQLFLQLRGSGNTWTTVCQGVNSTSTRTSNEDCTYASAASGNYRVRVTTPNGSNDAADNVDIDVYVTYEGQVTTPQDSGCSAPGGTTVTWGGCTEVVPNATRNASEEFTNYATWFSYHRTRMKIAKAGAADAFSELGNSVRVGYRTIWNRSNYDIPVGDGNSGKFEGTAKTTWFDRLFAARGRSATPLHGALQGTGEYFKSTANTGPYGPESSPNQLACRQNFAILTTDGYWNDFSNYTSSSIGDQDSTNGVAIYNPEDETTAIRYTVSHPYRDTNTSTKYSNTLADVAMHYWKTDLRDDLDNIVPVATATDAFWQSMISFGISIGLQGTLDQNTVAQVIQDGRPRINGSNVSWPDPTDAENAERIDDLLHAAVNGHGEFIAATSAEVFADALTTVLGSIQSRLASGSNVTTNSATFETDTWVYNASYRSGLWYGDLEAHEFTQTGGINPADFWRVSTRITASYADGPTTNDYDRRTILTWTGAAGATFPTSGQTTALARTGVTGAENVAYIKGVRTLEGTLRVRTSVFGDIINSSPIYVADSDSLFVGANDGMLHSISAATGDVQFSYVPAGINFTNLATLSDPAYNHYYFVDGPVAVSPFRVSTGTNYLVGALGRGGKGVFALDVTDPNGMAAADVLWDKTAATDADMGHVLGLPLIVKGNNNELLAIVGNGIDSTNGDSVLYVYDVTDGTQLAKINTGADSANGLFAPRAADLTADGKIDYVFAGDLKGNLWKFDFTSSNPADWAVALAGSPLFVATDAVGNRQPITGDLALAQDPDTDDVFISFGTGRMISISDLTSDSVQSLYSIIDGDEALGRADLTERTIALVVQNAGQTRRAFENYEALPASSSGWFVDLGDPIVGERVVSGTRVYGRAMVVSSVVPLEGDGCEPDGTGFVNVIDVFTGTSPETSAGSGTSTSFFDLDQDGSGDDETLTGPDGTIYYNGSMGFEDGSPNMGARTGSSLAVCGSESTCEVYGMTAPTGGSGTPRRLSWRELFGED